MLTTFNLERSLWYSEAIIPSDRTHVFTKSHWESKDMLKQLQGEGYTVSFTSTKAFREVDGKLQRVAFHSTEDFATWKYGGLSISLLQFTRGSLSNLSAEDLLCLLHLIREEITKGD